MTDTAELVISCKAQGTEQIDRMGKSLTGLDGIAAKVGGTLAGLFAVHKLVQWGKQSVAAFQATQDAAWQFSQTFSKIQKDAEDVFKGFADGYGLSEKSARSMLSSTGDLLKGFGFSQKQALSFAEAAAKLGSDLAGYKNYAGGAEGATQAITKAMLGESEQMKGLGVLISQSSEQYQEFFNAFKGGGMSIEELRKKLGNFSSEDKKVQAEYDKMIAMLAKGKNLTDAQAKAMTAIAVIMKSTPQAFGDTIKAGESFSQTMMNQGQALQQMMSDIGGMIYETFNLNSAMQGVTDAMKSVSAWIKKNGNEMVYAFQSVWLSIETGARKALVFLEPIFTGMTAGIENILAIGQWFYDNWGKIWESAGEIGNAVWLDLQQTANDCFEFIRTAFTSSVTFWGDVLVSFGQNWTSIFSDIWEISKRTIASIGTYFTEAVKNIGTLAASLGKNFWGLITGKQKFSNAMGSVIADYAKMVEDSAKKISAEWDGFEFGKGTKKFGEDVADASMRHFERMGEKGAALIANMGKNTEAALKKAGTTPLPELKTADYRAWTDPEYIKGKLSGIDSSAAEKRSQIEEAYLKRSKGKDLQNLGEDVADAADAAGNGLEKLGRDIGKLRETAINAIDANSIEAIKLQSRQFLGGSSNNGMQSMKNETEKLTAAAGPAAQSIRVVASSIQDLGDSLKGFGGKASAEQLKNWGSRFNPETGKMDGDQKREGWRGIISVTSKTDMAAMDELQSKINELSAKIIPITFDSDLREISTLENKLAELKAATVPVNVAADTEEISRLENKLAELKAATVPIDIKANTEEISRIEAMLSQLKSKTVPIDVQTNAEEISQIETRLAELKEKNEKIMLNPDFSTLQRLKDELSEITQKSVMTEVSVGTEINGKQVEIPLIIPESTEDDLKRIAKVAMGAAVPDDLLAKAVDFAQKRMGQGKSPFYNGEQEDEPLRNIYTEGIQAEAQKLAEAVKPAEIGIQSLAACIQKINATPIPVADIPKTAAAPLNPPKMILQTHTENITTRNTAINQNMDTAEIKAIAAGMKELIQIVGKVVQSVQKIESTNSTISTQFSNLGVSTM